jgi:hypothetical protein
MRQTGLVIFLGALLLTLSACGTIGSLLNRGAGDLGSNVELAVDSTAYLTCSAACSANAQCGSEVTDANLTYVFLNDGQPATENHSRLGTTGTAVTIREMRREPLAKVADPTQKTEGNFYRVAGEGFESFVAGWCLSTAAP